MHKRFLVVLLAVGSLPAWAQSPSRTVGPSTTVPASTQVQDNAYMIAPGVAVTTFYQNAPTDVPAYDPNAAQGLYTNQAYQSAQVPVYTGGTGAMTLPSTQTASYQASYPTGSYPAVQGGATPYDNSPYRFDMQQNGKQMSAQDFEAWMQSRGIRIAGGKR